MMEAIESELWGENQRRFVQLEWYFFANYAREFLLLLLLIQQEPDMTILWDIPINISTYIPTLAISVWCNIKCIYLMQIMPNLSTRLNKY